MRAMTARIGPNAVIQLDEALRARGEGGLAALIFAAAGQSEWRGHPPEAMVDERAVARLHAALWRLAPAAAALARDAGTRTADYIMANRIPRAARGLLTLLPAALAEPLLVRAIARHAWTFAGSGAFAAAPGRPARFTIAANPLARAEPDARCAWHEAVFTRLWQRLVTPHARVVERCCGHGTGACRFEVER